MKTTIVWFRQDLRLHDNPALYKASVLGNVIPVFIWPENVDTQAHPASYWWLHHSLIALEEKLASQGFSLIIRTGESQAVLTALIAETGADAIFFNERYELENKQSDEAIQAHFRAENITTQSFNAHLLYPPYETKNKKNEPYKIFTSYYKNVLSIPIKRPVAYPEKQSCSKQAVRSMRVAELNLLPESAWDKKFHAYWEPGEDGAIKQFEAFAENGLAHYAEGRDIPSAGDVSFLSPYLTWGNISVKAIWYALDRREATESLPEHDVQMFKRQLIWRDFAYHQLIHFPEITSEPLRAEFKAFPWLDNEADFVKWQKGLTGYPLVDAGMRELWETGVIHNRVRMVVASFLVKHLLVSWTCGYTYFSETLVDFDRANNALGWQWITGCGIETAPYFRIFNPILQSQKFDAEGTYIRKWVPELAKLDNKHIHQPWEAKEAVLERAGVVLGETYPKPIVNHPLARKRALAAFEQIKKK